MLCATSLLFLYFFYRSEYILYQDNVSKDHVDCSGHDAQGDRKRLITVHSPNKNMIPVVEQGGDEKVTRVELTSLPGSATPAADEEATSMQI